MTWEDRERKAISFHNAQAPEAVSLFTEGLSMCMNAMNSLEGAHNKHPHTAVMAVFLLRCIQGLYCAIDLALKAYYPQSFNLLRMIGEDWMAVMYFHRFPEDAELFGSSDYKMPEYGVMVRKLKPHFPDDYNRTLEQMRKRMHSFSHLNEITVRVSLSQEGSTSHVRYGPEPDSGSFVILASGILFWTGLTMEMINEFRLECEVAGIQGRKSFVRRQIEWQRKHVVAA